MVIRKKDLAKLMSNLEYAEEEWDDAAEAAVVDAERNEAWENVEINGFRAV